MRLFIYIPKLTHISFVFERKLTVITSTMEMCGPLAVESAVRRSAFLGGSESLKSFLYYGRVFSMVVCVHLHVRRADVDLITRALQYYTVVNERSDYPGRSRWCDDNCTVSLNTSTTHTVYIHDSII